MFRAGQQIGVYTLINLIGRGGFGEVWLAEKRSHFVTKKVAIKLPLDEKVDFEAIRQEATLWEQASGHANVLPIIDADVYDGQVVIVSEYADGGSLADILKGEGKLPTKKAVQTSIGILKGLEYLHNKRIIHRDIKPANILLQGDTPRLADFGISRAMQTTGISSQIIGTDAYMSPESFRGLRTVETDIWSVGVVLYQLLNGRLPFPQENPSERMYAILQNDFEPMSTDIPQDLRRIVEQALAKLPEKRYRSAGTMRDELKSFLVHSESGPQSLIHPIPEQKPDGDTITHIKPNSFLPETKLANPQEQKTLPAIRFSSPPSSKSAEKPRRIWLYLAGVAILVVSLILALVINLDKDNIISNANNARLAATPTPMVNYDIPEIQATVKDSRLFEAGAEGLPLDQRKYGTIFNKSSTRYIYYELALAFPSAEYSKTFTLEYVVSKETNLRDNWHMLHSWQQSQSVEKTWTDSYHSSGYGNASYGNLEAGSYKFEIKHNGKVIASKNFNIRISLAGTWDGAIWGEITISPRGSSYSGSYSLPKGTFNLNYVTEGIYRGTWKNVDNSKWGDIERAVVSADGDTISVTWGYSYPESSRSSGKSSTWTRKKNE